MNLPAKHEPISDCMPAARHRAQSSLAESILAGIAGAQVSLVASVPQRATPPEGLLSVRASRRGWRRSRPCNRLKTAPNSPLFRSETRHLPDQHDIRRVPLARGGGIIRRGIVSRASKQSYEIVVPRGNGFDPETGAGVTDIFECQREEVDADRLCRPFGRSPRRGQHLQDRHSRPGSLERGDDSHHLRGVRSSQGKEVGLGGERLRLPHLQERRDD